MVLVTNTTILIMSNIVKPLKKAISKFVSLIALLLSLSTS